ncbi:MAG: phosphoglycerate dehydrogenase [Phycisphaeraceae bacterium]|nr:phosphoglycerate dehydrogenase [Phycisphaeraceae bacterium]
MNKEIQVVVTTIPFGAVNPKPLQALEQAGLKYEINPLGRKLRPEEVASVIGDADIIIAGTEPITAKVMEACQNLKAICRVGIGLDSVDLIAARKRGIAVSFTPDGPSPAVAELTIGLMIDLLREVTKADRNVRAGTWIRKAGRRLSECTVGIIGCGRIGGGVIRHLSGGFPGVKILANDLKENSEFDNIVTWADKERIYAECDVISLHVPLTPETKNLVGSAEFSCFKKNAVLLNTARGGVVNEAELAIALRSGQLATAAIDAFEDEPYEGELCNLENTVLTCHLGSMTEDCRANMEIEATEDAIRFAQGMAFASPVPEDEYVMAQRLANNK